MCREATGWSRKQGPAYAVFVLYQTFYITACQYVHVDVMSAQSYFSKCDPYDELDRTLIASLIVGLLSVFLLLQIASNDTTLTANYRLRKQVEVTIDYGNHSEIITAK